jgi:hypothetical protein
MFYAKAVKYVSENLGKVPEEDLKDRLTIALLMDELIAFCRVCAGDENETV